MAEAMKVGSLVRLKSGGVPITVSKLYGGVLTGAYADKRGDPKEIVLPQACFMVAVSAIEEEREARTSRHRAVVQPPAVKLGALK